MVISEITEGLLFFNLKNLKDASVQTRPQEFYIENGRETLKLKYPMVIFCDESTYEFLKKIDIPIITTWTGFDIIDYKHKNYIGTIGVYGSRAANFTVQNSDLILCLGTRLDTRVTGGVPSSFARNAKKIIYEISGNSL